MFRKLIIFSFFAFIVFNLSAQTERFFNRTSHNYSQILRIEQGRGYYFTIPKQVFKKVRESNDVLSLMGSHSRRISKGEILWANTDIFYHNSNSFGDAKGRSHFAEMKESSFFHFWDSNFSGAERVLFFEEIGYDGTKTFQHRDTLKWFRDEDYFEAILSGYDLGNDEILTILYNSTFQAPPEEKLTFYKKNGQRLQDKNCPISFDGEVPIYHKTSNDNLIIISKNGTGFSLDKSDKSTSGLIDLGGQVYGYEKLENTPGFFLLFKDSLVHFGDDLQVIEKIQIEAVNFASEDALVSNSEDLLAIYGNAGGSHYLQKLNYDGNLRLVSSKAFSPNSFGALSSASFFKMDSMNNFYCGGEYELSVEEAGWEIIKVDENLNEVLNYWGWEMYRGTPNRFEGPKVQNLIFEEDNFYASIFLGSGGVGFSEVDGNYISYFQSDIRGREEVKIKGKIFLDENLNCKFEEGESVLENIRVAQPNSPNHLFSDRDGVFCFIGSNNNPFEAIMYEDFQLGFDIPDSFRICPIDYGNLWYQKTDTMFLDVPMVKKDDCLNRCIEANLSNNLPAPCDSILYTIKILNNEHQKLINGELRFEWDTLLDFQSFSLPDYQVLGNELIVSIPEIDSLGELQVELKLGVSCDAPFEVSSFVKANLILPQNCAYYKQNDESILKVDEKCSLLSLEIKDSEFNVCSENIIEIIYQNTGNSMATNSEIELRIDPDMIDIEVSDFPFQLVDSLLKINIGDIAPSMGDTAIVHFTLKCDNLEGDSICLNSTIIPNQVCQLTSSNDYFFDLCKPSTLNHTKTSLSSTIPIIRKGRCAEIPFTFNNPTIDTLRNPILRILANGSIEDALFFENPPDSFRVAKSIGEVIIEVFETTIPPGESFDIIVNLDLPFNFNTSADSIRIQYYGVLYGDVLGEVITEGKSITRELKQLTGFEQNMGYSFKSLQYGREVDNGRFDTNTPIEYRFSFFNNNASEVVDSMLTTLFFRGYREDILVDSVVSNHGVEIRPFEENAFPSFGIGIDFMFKDLNLRNGDTLFASVFINSLEVSARRFQIVVKEYGHCRISDRFVQDRFYTMTQIPSSINHLPENDLNIFPNPSNHQIHFAFDTPPTKPLQFTLYNPTGQKVLFREERGDFVVEKWEVGSGVFFFELRESGVVVERGKVIML